MDLCAARSWDRFGLRANQLSIGARVPTGAICAIEVLSGD